MARVRLPPPMPSVPGTSASTWSGKAVKDLFFTNRHIDSNFPKRPSLQNKSAVKSRYRWRQQKEPYLKASERWCVEALRFRCEISTGTWRGKYSGRVFLLRVYLCISRAFSQQTLDPDEAFPVLSSSTTTIIVVFFSSPAFFLSTWDGCHWFWSP